LFSDTLEGQFTTTISIPFTDDDNPTIYAFVNGDLDLDWFGGLVQVNRKDHDTMKFFVELAGYTYDEDEE